MKSRIENLEAGMKNFVFWVVMAAVATVALATVAGYLGYGQ